MLPDSSLTVFYHDQEYAIGNTKHAIDMMQLATPWLLVLIQAESTAQDTLRFLQLWSCHQNHHSCLTVQILQRRSIGPVMWSSQSCLSLQLSPECVAAAEDVDLVVVEGMGRAIETNLYASFSCDSLKLAMVKHPEVCLVQFSFAAALLSSDWQQPTTCIKMPILKTQNLA